MSTTPDIESLFALWEHNVDAVRAINRVLKQQHSKEADLTTRLVDHLKHCAVALASPRLDNRGNSPERKTKKKIPDPSHLAIDKSVLAISAPKRHRDKAPRRYVARQPCVICGRRPSQAHHLRHAQSRGLSLKVSDEFTVPLCTIHHHEVHRVGREEAWWQERQIDPLAIAKGLWDETLNAKKPGSSGQSS